MTATEKLRDLAVTHGYKILNQWLYRDEPGVCSNKEHVFALELPAETGVTLNPGEHGDGLHPGPCWNKMAVIETIGQALNF